MVIILFSNIFVCRDFVHFFSILSFTMFCIVTAVVTHSCPLHSDLQPRPFRRKVIPTLGCHVCAVFFFWCEETFGGKTYYLQYCFYTHIHTYTQLYNEASDNVITLSKASLYSCEKQMNTGYMQLHRRYV